MRTRIAATIVCLAFSTTVWAGRETAALFDKLEHDFGKADRGTKLATQFTIHNTTGHELRVKSLRVSCHCTKATMAVSRILPGESATVDALMDTSGFLGSKSVTIYVQFERPRWTEVALRVSCVSTGNVTSGTNEIDFGVLAHGQKVEKRMSLEYTGNPDWKVTGLDFGSPHIHAEIHEVSRSGNQVKYELKVAVLANAPAGQLEDRIVLHTNDRTAPDVLVLAKARIESKIVVSPDALRLGTITSGQKISKSVILKASMPFKVKRADNTLGQIEVRAGAEAKTTQLVVLNITVPADPTTLTDHVQLITDLDGEQIVTIPIQQ